MARIAELEQELDVLRREALTDELTGVLNRRAWDRALAAESDRCSRHGIAAVVVAIDLDGFKQLNDRRGHHAGDAMLRRCAAALQRGVRAHDHVARVGGDEFAVLAIQTAPASTGVVAQRIGAALESGEVAATLGAAASADAADLRDTWRVADERMLAAKRRSGRAGDANS